MKYDERKKRNPLVLKAYYILFKVMFVAWVIFAIRYCSPETALFYNFSSSAPASYQSYDEYINSIKNYEKRYEKKYKKEMFWTSLWSKMQSSASSYEDVYNGGSFSLRSVSLEYGDTNNQVDGVSEGDVIKNDGRYLYILSEHPSMVLDTYPHILLDGTLTIVDAYLPADMNVVCRIGLVSGEAGETYREYSDIYISGQNLIILSVEQDYNNYYSAVTWAYIYDITDPNKPVYKRTFKLDGYLINSREQNGILYLFSVKNIWWDHSEYYNYYNYYYEYYLDPPEITDQDRYIPYYFDTDYGENQYVRADRLHTLLPKSKENYNSRISTINIAAIDLSSNTPAEVSSYTYAGSYFPQLYMSAENNIYLMQYNWEKGIEYTDILKLSVDKTNVQYAASKKVPGYMHNQFSADEYKGIFRIATTEGRNGNHLFILDGDLNFISYIKNMAVRERIKSVRFDGDIGYIVTFVNTDPLFILDLSDSQSPKITAELKIPGYSTYLHPLGNRLLLGVGDDTVPRYFTDENGNEIESGFMRTGIKASLFDVSDPYNPKETSVLKLGGVSSSTDIGNNHKSFLNIPKYSMFSVRGLFTDIAETEYTDDKKNQALLISYGKDDELKLVQTFDGADYDYNFSAMNRITYIKDIIYHFDGEAVNAYDMNVTDGNNFIKIGSVYYK